MSLGSENFNDISIYRTYVIQLTFPDMQISKLITEQHLVCDKSDIKIGLWMMHNFNTIYNQIAAPIIDTTKDDITKDTITVTAEIQSQFKTLDLFFSIFSVPEDMYVYAGKFDSKVGYIVCKLSELESDTIRIKCRRSSHSLSTLEISSNNHAHRTKERKIGSIINKVEEWRQLYKYGKTLPNSIVKKYSLEEAAQEVGISKKSLDDYLLQLRFGREHGFDFNKNKDEKVGVLRKFVKNHKKYEFDKNNQNNKVFEIIEYK